MGFSLLPKQERFYTYLTDLAAQANLCARLLLVYVEAGDAAGRDRAAADIKASRSASKTVMGKLTDDLGRSFITPFDREDIQSFAQCLYRIPKIIEKTVERMSLHGMAVAQPDFARQSALIAGEAQVMEDMVAGLISRRDSKGVMDKAAQLHDLEQQGDDILQDLLAALFKDTREARDLILRKDIYDLMEKTIDCYRDAAAVTLQIVLKYS